jgi:hypothetical protein
MVFWCERKVLLLVASRTGDNISSRLDRNIAVTAGRAHPRTMESTFARERGFFISSDRVLDWN